MHNFNCDWLLCMCIYSSWISIIKLSAALHYMPYFLLGMVYCCYKMKIDSFINRYWLLMLLISFLVSATLITEGYLAALTGISFSVTGALLLEEKCPNNVVKISSLCYTVFLLSYFPQMLIRGPIASKVPFEYEYILSVISFVSGIAVPMSIAKLYNRLVIKHRGLVRYGILIGL